MEKQSYPPMSLLSILPDGKVENDARITDKAVTGVCTVYLRRSDNENEFLLREVGVALIDGSCNLTDAVRIATDQAYNAAISRIMGARLFEQQQTPQVPGKTSLPVAQPIQVPSAKPMPPTVNITGDDNPPSAEVKAAPVAQTNESPSGAAAIEPIRPPIDLPSVLNAPGKPTTDNTPPILGNGAVQSEAIGGIERIEFTDKLPPRSRNT